MNLVRQILAMYLKWQILIDQARETLCDAEKVCSEDVADVLIDCLDRGQLNHDFILSFDNDPK